MIDAESPAFARNLGTLGAEGQRALAASKVLVIGCGGIGGIAALALARSGVGSLVMVDPDSFEESNLNRQATCVPATLGANKAFATRDAVDALRVGTETRAIGRVLDTGELEREISAADAVFPAADDFAYSLDAFAIARRLGKPALMVVPAGLWALVTVMGAAGPRAERMHGLPRVRPVGAAREFFSRVVYPRSRRRCLRDARWSGAFFDRFSRGLEPPSQLCPTVWAAASLGALELVKKLSGAGQVVEAPRYYRLDARGASTRDLRAPRPAHIALAASALRLRLLANASGYGTE